MRTEFTLILPVHNEEPILSRNVAALHEYMERLGSLDSFEIILACNGCTDRSEEISEGLSRRYPRIRHLHMRERGLGRAIKEAVTKASYDMMMFYAVDLPFGLSIIGESIDAALKNERAVVVGSKGHRDSTVERGLMRRLFSVAISVLNRLFFGLDVKDTQGSILFYKEPFRRYGHLMDSPGAFFQAQILIYSRLSGLKLIEIPVTLEMEARKTRFSLAADGLRYIAAMFREKKKLMAERDYAPGASQRD